MDRPLVATEFVLAISEQVDRLSEFPLMGRTGACQDTRALMVHKNDLVTYHVRADEVQVLQVWNSAKKTGSRRRQIAAYDTSMATSVVAGPATTVSRRG